MRIRQVLLSFVVIVTAIFPNQIRLYANHAPFLSTRLLLTNIQAETSVSTISTRTFTKRYSVEKLRRQPSERGMQYFLPGCETLQIPHCPLFPYEKVVINLNNNETVTYLKILSFKAIELPDFSVPLAVAPEPKPISMPDPGLSDIKQTDIPTLFPETNAQFIITKDQQTNLMVIQVMPLYKVDRSLIFASEMIFEYGIGIIPSATPSSPEGKDKSFILTDISLESSGKKLQAIQQADGYDTELVFVQQLKEWEEAKKPSIANIQGFMDVTDKDRARIQGYDYSLARRIQTWLQKQKTDDKPIYLTILGDASFVPPSYYLLSSDKMSDYDKWVPTEFFYICPNALSVSLNGSTMPFEYRVGRLPVRDVSEAEAMVNKIERYRKNLKPDWYHNMAVFAGDPFNEDFFAELSTSKAINENYLDGFAIEKFYRSEGLFTTDPFLKVMSEGKRGLVWGFGHGSGDGLALEPGYADARQIMSLPIKNEYPIFISEACGNGAYDSRLAKGPFGSASSFTYPTSFSEAILNSKGGGIAYIGGARINYAGWSMTYDNGIPMLHRVYYMDAMLEYFVKNLTLHGGSLGQIAQFALKEYAENDWFTINAPLLKTFFGFCLQGDPTIRLPNVSDGISETIPELKVSKESPKTSRQIPLYSIDDGADILVKTGAKQVRTILVDYDNASKRILFDDWVQNPSQVFKNHIDTYPKSRLAMRYLTPEGKENRIVFFGRYNHDIVIRQEYDLDWISQGEKKSFYCQVRNDGLFSEKKVQVTVLRNEQSLLDQTLSEIPVMSSRYVYYQIEDGEPGEAPIILSGSVLPGETFSSDNTMQIPLIVTEKKPIRVGILNASSMIDFNYYRDRLMLKALNDYFRKQGHQIDFSIIPMGMDRQYHTTLSRLQYDAVLLYTTNAFYYPVRELLSLLTEFSNQGGVVFAMFPLGLTGEGISLQPWQTFFGISPSEKFQQFQLTDKTQEFEILAAGTTLFRKPSYQLSSRYTCKPSNKSWDKVELTESGELIGLSKSGDYGLVKNGHRYMYSGFISEIDMKKKDDSMLFFEHLFSILESIREEPSSQSELIHTTIESVDSLPEVNDDPDLPAWIDFSQEGQFISPSCIDLDNNTRFISQTDGIIEVNAEGDIIRTIPYDTTLLQVFGANTFRELTSVPNRAFLRKSDNYLLLSSVDRIAVCEYPTGKFLRVIERVSYQNYATPLVLFDQLFDIEVSGSTAYVLDPYFGLSLINLDSGNLLSKIPISDYLWDIGIIGDQLAGCTFYGNMFTMNTDGTEQHFYGTTEDIYCNSFLYASENEFYINTYLPDRVLMKVSLANDQVVKKNQIGFPSTLRGYLERFTLSDEYFETITYSVKRSGSFGIESKWVRLDSSFEHPTEPGKEHLRSVLKDKNYITHPENVWLTEENQVLVSMDYPSNPLMFKLFDTDGILIKNIKAGSELYDQTILYKQYLGHQKIGIIFESRGNYWMHLIDFSGKTEYETIPINTAKARCKPENFLFHDEELIILDQWNSGLVVFELQSGSEIDRFDLVTEGDCPTLYKASVMQAIEDRLYLLDPYQQKILVFELSSGSFIRSLPLPAITLDACNPLALRVVSEQEILLLDSYHSQLYAWKEDVWSPLAEDTPWLNPISMDSRNGYLVVNDISHERLQLYPYDKGTELLSRSISYKHSSTPRK